MATGAGSVVGVEAGGGGNGIAVGGSEPGTGLANLLPPLAE